MQLISPDVRAGAKGVLLASGINSTVLIGPVNLLRYVHKVFVLYNMSASTISGASIQSSPDVTGSEPGASSSDPQNPAASAPPTLWENIDTTSFQDLASGGIKSVTFIDARRWWRVLGTNNIATGQSLTVSGYFSAQTV